MSAGEMSRRIPDNLGGTDTLLDNAPIVGSVEAMDGIIAFGPSLFTLFIFESFVPPGLKILSFLFSGIVFFIGVLALLAKPSYLTLNEWISDVRRFRNQPNKYRKALPSGKGGDETDSSIDTIEVNSDRDTRNKINLERIYPQYDAVERPDGTVVGIFRVRGLNLDSANDQTVRNKINQFDNLLNQNLREDIQMYMPMQRFDPTEQVSMYEDRVEDDEVMQNDPLMQEYINDRISFLTAMSLGSYIRRYYIVCEVSKNEVLTKEAQAAEGKRLLEKAIPGSLGEFAGNLYTVFKGPGSMMTDDEMKERQLEELEDRRAQISNMFAGLGCKTKELNADEVGVLMKEFWEGVHVSDDETEGFIRKSPYVRGDRDVERGESVDNDLDSNTTRGDM